jgi:hypothetical protein
MQSVEEAEGEHESEPIVTYESIENSPDDPVRICCCCHAVPFQINDTLV